MQRYRTISLFLIAVGLTACDGKSEFDQQSQSGTNPPLPAAQSYLLPPMKVPKGIGWGPNEKPAVVSGLKIECIAADLKHPRKVLGLPNGDILVVEANRDNTESKTTPKQIIAGKVIAISGKGASGANRITLLRKNKINSAWERFSYIEGLNSPFGIQLIGEDLYVANTDGLLKFKYRPDETRMSASPELVTDLPAALNHHWTKELVASPDGKKIYVGVGSNSNIYENGSEVEYRRAVILEVDLETKGSRIYASGLRNATGLAWEPSKNQLWAAVNERDEIGPDLVPDYITSVKDGGFYGWPYSYFGKHVDKRVQPSRPDLIDQAIEPNYSLGAHVAPLGILFSENLLLPKRYRQGAFISEHGSWGRSPIAGFQVAFIPFKDGMPTGTPEPIVTGFTTADESRSMGAPVGLTADADGALIIADDVGNSVWRVTTADENH